MNFASQDFVLIAPQLILTALGFLIILIGLIFPRLYRETLAAIVLIGLAAAIFVALQNWNASSTVFNDMLVADKFSAGFQCIFIIGAALTVLLSLNELEGQYLLYSEYFAIVIFATVGMMLMAAGSHLLTIFLGLETLSISLYILAGFRRTHEFALESSFKYFLLGAFASGFLLYGIALVYGATGSANLQTVSQAIRDGNLLDNSLLTTGIVLLFIGFGFKIALAPFHQWAPDVYQGAPTPVAAFMATGSKAAGFAALLRVVMASGILNDVRWQDALWVVAVLTMTIGNIIALRQENIKRMLAYSSIAHAGYILVGVIAANERGYSSVLFYLLSYTFMNVGAFGVVSMLSDKSNETLRISDYRGLAQRRPLVALAMAVFMFSLAGIPPSAGFVGKFYVFGAAVQAGYIWLVVLGVLNSLVSLYYYLGVVVNMYMHDPVDQPAQPVPLPTVGLALAIAVFAILDLGIFPARWIEAFQDLAASLK
jgi:NADH-quinone oxidoreductase subunit N